MELKLTDRGLMLRVKEAYPEDVGKGRVRISKEAFSLLNLSLGDVILIQKRGRTVATVWHLPVKTDEKDVIMMDGDLRRNAGVGINEFIFIKKTKVREAKQIVLAPLDVKVSVKRDLERFLRTRLLDRPLLSRNVLTINLFGNSLMFIVCRTSPQGPVIVTPETRVILREKPIPKLDRFVGVTYEDIGGLGGEIRKIREMVELPLKYPEIFRRLNIEPPKGVLLYGPPGCGKTLLAKAVANEADANFYAINGPEIASKYYGESEAKLRSIFKKAQENAPSIIFIDEIDAIAPKREEVTGEVEKRIVSQLLALMDGLEARGQVVVIAATNRPEALDPALRRPGRFDREIEIRVPDQKGRLEILQIHTRGMPLASDVSLEKLAEITHGYTGADLALLCREAAMNALRRYLPKFESMESVPSSLLDEIVVTMNDFMKAYREIVPTALREVEVQIPRITWDDIGGLYHIKRALREAVEWPLKWPDKFKKWGIPLVKGILLYGPPGTGKTLLAQALATECNVNFIAIRGSELLSKWVGESEKGIRRVFQRARMAAPCIIFFEEIEAIAPRRGYSDTSGVIDRVISQLLVEMDGIARLADVIVIAASNRPDLIDEALLRPGRIDLMLYVPPPNEKERLEILKIHTRRFDLSDDVNLEEIAKRTQYYTGADLALLCREAAMNALRRDINAQFVIMDDFLKALERIKPSLNEQIIKWYEDFYKSLKYPRLSQIPAIT